MKTTVRVILIDPFAKTVTEVQVGKGSFSHDVRKLMDCDCFTGVTHLDNGDMLLADDEGLFKRPDNFFKTDFYPAPIAGKAVIMGNEDSDGNVLDVKTPTGFDVLWLNRNDTRLFQHAEQSIAEKSKASGAVVITMKDVFDAEG